MRFKFLLGFLLLCPALIGLNAQTPEYTRHISKSFRAASALSVEISNKYGRVHVVPWDEDSIKFSIDMKIRAKDNTKLEKIKQNVDFEFTPGQYFIIARTKFGDGSTDVFKDIMDIAGSYFSASNSVTINYTVMLPSHVALKIENKFGDVYLGDHTGAFTLVLSYGDLKANRLEGRSEIKISNGDADINYIKDGLVTVSYSNLHIRESGKLSTQTQASVVTIEKSGSIKMNSRRDKLFINDIRALTGESYFSDINIGNLYNEITLNCRLGDLSVDKIKEGFSTVNLSSELTDITLTFERPVNFDFDLSHAQSVTFSYPKSGAHLSTKEIDPEDKILSTSGNFGGGTSGSRVNIKALRKAMISISQL